MEGREAGGEEIGVEAKEEEAAAAAAQMWYVTAEGHSCSDLNLGVLCNSIGGVPVRFMLPGEWIHASSLTLLFCLLLFFQLSFMFMGLPVSVTSNS